MARQSKLTNSKDILEMVQKISDNYIDNDELDNALQNKQDKEDVNLNTEDKTIIGAINELDENKLEVEDLPCYDSREYGSITLTYDGNKETKEVLDIEAGASSLIKITDDVSINDLEGLSAADVTIYASSSDGQTQEETVNIADAGGCKIVQENVYEAADSFIMLVLEDTKVHDEIDITKGLWVMHINASYGGLLIDYYVKSLTYNRCISGELKKIDEKYLEKKPGVCSEGKSYTYTIYDDPDERTTETTVTHVGEAGAEAFNTTEIHESKAIGEFSHAEGFETIAYGYASHAEGDENVALGSASHAEGLYNYAVGSAAHAEGTCTSAMKDASHAEGDGTIANGDAQHVQGTFNIKDTENKYAHIVGNGKSREQRSNAHTLDWDGNAWFAGKATVSVQPTENNDLTTKEYVDNAIAQASIDGEVDTSGFALKTELFSKDYNDLTNKPTIPTVPTDVSSFNNDAGYISSIPAEYITESELNAKGYLTEHQDISGKADKTYVDGFINSGQINISCIDGSSANILAAHNPNDGFNTIYYSTKAYISSSGSIGTEENINAKAFYEDGAALIDKYATKEYVDNAIDQASIGGEIDTSEFALKSELFSGSYNDLTNKPVIPSIQGLASESYVNQQISKIQHPTYDDTSIKNQLANKADKSELFSGDYNDLSNKPSIPSIAGLATENFVTNKIAEAQLKIEGDVIVDLQGYATKDDLALKADKTEVPSIEGLASESYVQQEIAKVQGNGGGDYAGDDGVSEDEKAYVDDMMYSALGGLKLIKITQERYDALTTKDPNTIYIVVSAENMNNSTGENGVSDIYNLKWTEGSNLSDTGSVVTNDSQAAYRLSDFIKVNSEYNYRVNTSSSSQFQVFYYDKNKNYIGKSTIRNDKTAFALYGYEGFIEFPEDVKYLRIRTNNKTSAVEINEIGKRDDTFTAFQFREGYTVASNGSVSAASGYMVSGDIKLEPDYDYNITFDGNKTRVVFFNTDGNKTGNCLPTDSTYYNETTTLTRADIPEAAVSFRMRFATGGEVNMNNIHEHLQVIKTPKASKYITPISSWMQSKGFDENGEEIDDISAMNTGYVTITSGYDYMYTLKRGVPFGFQIYYYDSSKTFISCSEVQDDPIGNKRFDIPSGAAYYRIKVSQENSLTLDNVNENVEIKKMPAVEGMLYQFGVLSDCHVDAGSDGNFYDTNHATNDYRKAVKFLEDEGAEFIAYGGDMATGDPGVSEQDYRKVLEILKNSYIPSYMISGNHDYGYFFKALIESRKYYVVEKENDMFIFVNVQDRGTTGGVDREIIDGVRALIENNPNKRLFLFYHYFIRNHGSGDGLQDVKYYTGDTLGDNYEDYPLSLEWANLIINTPNLIFCHGHSHFRFKCQEVYEFNNYYHADGECHSVHIPSCAVPREMSADSTTVTNMPEGSEGYIVKVFADRVEFHAVQLSAYRYMASYNFTINLPQGN